jgi:hypothetical protein
MPTEHAQHAQTALAKSKGQSYAIGALLFERAGEGGREATMGTGGPGIEQGQALQTIQSVSKGGGELSVQLGRKEKQWEWWQIN